MRQFKFDHKDIKAFGILGISVGLKWQENPRQIQSPCQKISP